MPETLTAAARTVGLEKRQRGAAVASLATAVPETVVDNAPIAERLGISESWIVERTGVRERRIAGPGESLTAFAARAASGALGAAGIEPEDLDLVLVATMSHDQLSPNAAPLVAAEIGAVRAGALDVGATCNGFLSALALAVGQIESERAAHVLVIGADLMSRLTDPDDRRTAALFGDGAGAVVLRSVEAPGRVGPVVLGADGARADLVRASREEALIRMKGPDTYRQAVDRLTEAMIEATAAAGVALGEVDLFACHQANSRIIRAVGERLRLPTDRVIDCVAEYGNTSAASIPIALAEAESRGMLREGATVLLAAFGGGLAWGAALIEWGDDA